MNGSRVFGRTQFEEELLKWLKSLWKVFEVVDMTSLRDRSGWQVVPRGSLVGIWKIEALALLLLLLFLQVTRRPGTWMIATSFTMEIKKRWKFMGAMLAVLITAVVAGTISSPASIPGCTCEDDGHAPSSEGMNRCQVASDFFIALAYFSIPLELLYFVSCSHMFPFRWVIIQFGAFIVLCGLTHFVSIWTFGPHSYSLVVAQTILKALTALVSCATAVTLVHIIPELLHVKVRELFLKHKAAELDREMDVIKTQEEVGRHVRMLTHVIRSSLDRHKVLNTTLIELSKTLSLENCTVWMPNAEGNALELTHELERRLVQVPVTISAGDPSVQLIVQNRTAIIIAPTSALGKASNHNQLAGAMAAVRLPLLHVSNFKGGTPEVVHASYAILVLVLPSDSGRQWQPHELQMIEVVADQVRPQSNPFSSQAPHREWATSFSTQ